jgi:hypothetical protein
MGFTNDLTFANIYEQDCIRRLKTAQKMNGNFKPYDIIDANGVKYEVKADRIAHRTGNVCIEYECRAKPSGIASSEADFYMYYVVKDKCISKLFKIPTGDIRRMIDDQAYHKTQLGGDAWLSRFYLFRIDLFERYALI